MVLGADGTVELALGEVDVPMFPRSSNKPMQAVAMLRSGFSPSSTEQVALSAASHSGEDTHVRAVLGLLAAAGLGEDDLACPADLPGHEPSRDAVLAAGGGRRRAYMNCSGKHAAMLSTCVSAGWPTTGYTDAEHPLQLAGRATVAELAGEEVSALGVDGCGAPIFALTLTGLARSFARLVLAQPGAPERRVADAMRAHPFLVSGTGREDLLLMGAVPGLLCKAGAEGVHVGALDDGRAFAVKIDDGAARARGPVTVGVLARWGIDVGALDALAAEPLLGGGAVVGAARLLPGVF